MTIVSVVLVLVLALISVLNGFVMWAMLGDEEFDTDFFVVHPEVNKEQLKKARVVVAILGIIPPFSLLVFSYLAYVIITSLYDNRKNIL
jgi:type III secretory pathway component EscV